MRKRCSVVNCGKGVAQAGLCAGHHNRMVNYGDPLLGPPIKRRIPNGCSPEDAFRFYMGSLPPAARDCWVWRGTITNHRYGSVMINGKNVLAHRISYKMFVGPLADDEVARHTCDNPPCVNPHHLLSGTQLDNARDAIERGRLLCGTRHPHSRLTPQMVRKIRAWSMEGITQRELAETFCVHEGTIQAVIDGKTWKHVA